MEKEQRKCVQFTGDLGLPEGIIVVACYINDEVVHAALFDKNKKEDFVAVGWYVQAFFKGE